MATMSSSLHHEPTSDSVYDLASLHDGLRLDFAEACAAFAEACRHQQVKDTPAHRAAVLERRAWIDAILDVHLDMHADRRHS